MCNVSGISLQSPHLIFTQSFQAYYYILKESEAQKRWQADQWEIINRTPGAPEFTEYVYNI